MSPASHPFAPLSSYESIDRDTEPSRPRSYPRSPSDASAIPIHFRVPPVCRAPAVSSSPSTSGNSPFPAELSPPSVALSPPPAPVASSSRFPPPAVYVAQLPASYGSIPRGRFSWQDWPRSIPDDWSRRSSWTLSWKPAQLRVRLQYTCDKLEILLQDRTIGNLCRS